MPDPVDPAAPPPAAPAPAPGAPPPPPAPPAAPPAPAAARGKGEYLRIPRAQFKARITREADKILIDRAKETLGVSIEEAKAIIAKDRAAAGGAPAAAGDPGATTSDEKKRLQQLEEENTRLKQQGEDDKRRSRRAVNRQKDERLAAELQAIAAQSGIKGDRPLSYAVNEYRAAVLATPDGTEPPQPAPFFSELLKTLPNLGAPGASSAPPVVVDQHPTTAPAGAPPPPPPAAPGARQAPRNAEEMSQEEFARHSQSVHGYRPGSY
jgi:Sec-independent protein translocase protein TatA